MQRGLIHLYWGDGKGKTTAAMGLALRALAAGRRVAVVQFLKGRPSGEVPLLTGLGAKIYRGKAGEKFVFQMTESEKQAARQAQDAHLLAALGEERRPADFRRGLRRLAAGHGGRGPAAPGGAGKAGGPGGGAHRPLPRPLDAGGRRLLHRDALLPPPLPPGRPRPGGCGVLNRPRKREPRADTLGSLFTPLAGEAPLRGQPPDKPGPGFLRRGGGALPSQVA